MLWTTLMMALREIGRNTMRSSLTILGVVIGVAAVIAMVTLGQGATNKVTSDIGRLGNNMLTIRPGAERHGPASDTATATAFTMADVRAIAAEVTAVSAVAPLSSKGALLVLVNRNWASTLTGSTNNFLTVRGYRMERGRRFSDAELVSGAAVCILGATTYKELFVRQDPIGVQLRAGNFSCTVVGLLESKGQASFGPDPDDLLLVPLAAFQRRVSGTDDVGSILVSAVSDKATAKAQSQIARLLRERRRIDPGQRDDFSVMDMKEIVQTLQTVTGALTALLSAIAAVSLLVGGIGIMNIMLVSVTERTREIGIRLAIGARARDVLLQFLVEAVVLSTIGGILGMLLGLGGSVLASRAMGWPFEVMPQVVLIALVFSATVGVAFGYYPARKAARLNPIDALRHE